MAQVALRNDFNATVLTASSGGHTIVAIVTAMRALFIHLARQFQKRNGAGYGHFPELYQVRPLNGGDAEEKVMALWMRMYRQYRCGAGNTTLTPDSWYPLQAAPDVDEGQLYAENHAYAF
jgi:hypothetical protein